MMSAGINKAFTIIVFCLFLSCRSEKKVDATKIDKINNATNSKKAETKPLYINADFSDFGEIKIERDSIEWGKINVDSLMIVNFSLKKVAGLSFEIKRSLIASRIPFHLKLQEEDNGNITLLFIHLFNKIYVDSLIFSKTKDEHRLKEAFNIYYGKVDGDWVCPSKINVKESVIYLEDISDSNKCVEIKNKE